jgi:hypothetical protein
LSEPLKKLPLPPEPAELRAKTRSLVEDSPEEGIRLVNEARFLADLLWKEWAENLEGAGMSYERLLQVARGYADEIRLWVMGERPWDHCVAGLAGRTLRRLPDKGCAQGAALACSGTRR